MCLSHAHFKRALVLFGEGDTGKSLVAKVLEMIVGKAFTCSLPVDQMDDPRRRAVIVGKRLNIMTELSADSMISERRVQDAGIDRGTAANRRQVQAGVHLHAAREARHRDQQSADDQRPLAGDVPAPADHSI